MIIQSHIFYTGNVQGVGFRYTAERFAKSLGLGGWVKNLSDGRVELVVEGPKEMVDDCLRSIEKHFGNNIQHIEKSEGPSAGSFKNFQIKI